MEIVGTQSNLKPQVLKLIKIGINDFIWYKAGNIFGKLDGW